MLRWQDLFEVKFLNNMQRAGARQWGVFWKKTGKPLYPGIASPYKRTAESCAQREFEKIQDRIEKELLLIK